MMRRFLVRLVVFVVVWLAGVVPASAQVLVSPPLLFMSDAERFGTYMVENRSQTPQEVTVNFRFGYPASDSLGNLFMQYEDPGNAAQFSLAEWVRAFPRQFVLEPGKQQIVRLTVRPPPDLATGVYWARLITASVPESPPVDTVGDGVTARIIFRLEQVTTAMYRHGQVQTGIEMGPLSVRSDSTGPQLIVPMKRTGTSPFLGTVTLRVEDAQGALVEELHETAAVYFDLVKRFAIPAGKLRSGTYTAKVAVAGERSDVPSGLLPFMSPVAGQVVFSVP